MGLQAGFNPTHPTFLEQARVIKFFGGAPFWKKSHQAESRAQRRVSSDPTLKVPRLIAEGVLFDGPASWPYLITDRIEGRFWHAGMTLDHQLSVAAALGEQLRRVHQLDPRGIFGVDDWDGLEPLAALAHSAFPRHLLPQVEGFLASLAPPQPAFIHGDLVANHVFVDGDRLAGIIDWGDAMVADPHAEVGKLFFHTFAGDRRLLRRFLEASAWPMTPDFPRKVLGHALHRQRVGLAQHYSFDIFNILPTLVPLESIGTIEELADRLFGVA